MTGDEYLVKRILELEQENKALKESKEIRFIFGTYYDLKPATYKLKIDGDKITITKIIIESVKPSPLL